MKKIKFILMILFSYIIFASCNNENNNLISRIEFAKQLKEKCMQGNCSDLVLCHYQNREYHYMIFEWQGLYYDFAWIESYPQNGYYSSDKAMEYQEAQDICNGL